MDAEFYQLPFGHLSVLSYHFCHLIYQLEGVCSCVILAFLALWAFEASPCSGGTGILWEGRCSDAVGSGPVRGKGACTPSLHSWLFSKFFVPSFSDGASSVFPGSGPVAWVLWIEGGMTWFQVGFPIFLDTLSYPLSHWNLTLERCWWDILAFPGYTALLSRQGELMPNFAIFF